MKKNFILIALFFCGTLFAVEIQREFIGSYVPIDFDEDFRAHNSFVASLFELDKDRINLLLITDNEIQIVKNHFFDVKNSVPENIGGKFYIENGNYFYIDNDGHKYKKISSGASKDFREYKEYVLSVIFHEAKENYSNVILRKDKVFINNELYSPILKMGGMDITHISLWLETETGEIVLIAADKDSRSASLNKSQTMKFDILGNGFKVIADFPIFFTP